MRPRAANGGIKERWNATGSSSHHHAAVALEWEASHLNAAAKAFAPTYGLSSGDHVKFAHAFATNGMNGFKHANLNRGPHLHLLEFPC